jgi:hypothetical protein
VVIVVATSASAVAPLLAGVLIAAFNCPVAVLVFSAVVGCSAVAASVSRGIRSMEPAGGPARG